MKCSLSFLRLASCSRNRIIEDRNNRGEIKIKQKSGERINWRRNLLAILMASLRTGKQPSNWLQKRYVYGDSEMALPGRTISARGVERAKTHKGHERGREGNNGWLAETFLVFPNRSPCHGPPYLSLSRWRTDSSISHENELAFPAISFPHLRRLVVSASRERNGRGESLGLGRKGGSR